MAGEEGPRIACKKGCHHCCYHPVVITLLEGLSLYYWLKDNHLWTTSLRDKLIEHSTKTWHLSFEVWFMSLIRCPLLSDDGLCTAYESRPFPCRVVYSTGDPHYCHPHRMGDDTQILSRRELFETLAVTETEILRRHRLPHFRLPLATSLLYAERIATGELLLEDTVKVFYEVPPWVK